MISVNVRFVQGLNVGVGDVREQFETREGAEAYVEMVLAKGVRIERVEQVGVHTFIVPPQRVLEIEIWGEEETRGQGDKETRRQRDETGVSPAAPRSQSRRKAG